MSQMEYTQKQQEAVESRRQDLLVHAGAGSGKTRVLVGRFYDLVRRDRLAPHQILTITFTEKAAQEMKDRLRRLFSQKQEGRRELARQVNHAYISTIHAFCARLLKENALEARIDPAFTVLEEYEAYRLQKEFLRAVLDRGALAPQENFLNFLLAVDSQDLEGELLKLYQQARGRGNTQFSFSSVTPGVENHRLAVSQILGDLDRAYGAYKDRQGWLDFADLELKAKKLLEDQPELRAELKAKWPHILLDELQDTNPLQLAILHLLRTPGQFFAVGDPHQSIYGFRFADLKAYEELQREVGRKGKILTLDKNFRSRRPLLQLVDYCFSPLWPKGTTFSHIPMEPGQEDTFAEKAFPSVEAIIFSSKTKEEGRSFEADTLCRRIYELVNREKLPIYDKAQKSLRPLEFSDCAILLRKTKFVKTWERALQKYGIPYQVVRSRGFFEAPEVADLLNLLKVLENPLDDLALASFLRSPLVGISEDTLWLLSREAKNDGRKSLYSALGKQIATADPGEAEKLVFAPEFLGRLRQGGGAQGWYSLLRRGMEETFYTAKSYLYPQGERIRANLHKLLQVVYEMSALGMEHLRDLLEVTDYLRYQKDVMAEGEVAPSAKGQLSLSTIHGAKGLEFPLVAVAELDSHLQYRQDKFSLTGAHGLVIKIKDPLTGEDMTDDSSSEPVKQRAREEELRLLYVALTRAQEHLLLSGSFKFNKDGGLHASQWVNLVEKRIPLIALLKKAGEAGHHGAEIGGVPVRLYWWKVSGEEADPLLASKVAPPAAKTQNLELTPEGEECGRVLLEQVARALEPTDGSHYLVTVTEVVDFYRCPRLYQLKYLWGLRGELWEGGFGEGAWPEARGPAAGEVSGRDLGSFMHQILERLDWADVGAQSRLGGMPLPIPDNLRGEEASIKQMLENFIHSNYGCMIKTARKWERELPFVVKVGGYSNTPPLLQGRVDAVIFDDADNYILLDYKLRRRREEEKSYPLQLQLYALALGKIYGIRPQKAVLYYLEEGNFQEVTLEIKVLEEAEHWVEKLFWAQKRQEFPQKPEYCSTCRQRKLCEQIKI